MEIWSSVKEKLDYIYIRISILQPKSKKKKTITCISINHPNKISMHESNLIKR